MKKILVLALLLILVALGFACGDNNAGNTSQNSGDTPTEAYKRLFAAVKSKNTEAIKAELSESTKGFAQSVAARQGKTVEEVYSNGFTATTFSTNLPEMRDERVKDRMGALEVWNATDKKWEDLPFVREDTGWKLAIGDIFANTYRSPGKGRDMVEREAANAMSPGKDMKRVEVGPANANFTGKPGVTPPSNK